MTREPRLRKGENYGQFDGGGFWAMDERLPHVLVEGNTAIGAVLRLRRLIGVIPSVHFDEDLEEKRA